MFDTPQRISKIHLAIGLGLIMLVSGCSWSAKRLSPPATGPEARPPAAETGTPVPDDVPPAAVEPADRTENLTVKKGETFSVTLESNITTGFSWQAEFDEKSVELIEQKYDESGAQDRVGAGGADVFKFRALAAGQTVVRFRYARPWESVQPAKTAVYEVTIE